MCEEQLIVHNWVRTGELVATAAKQGSGVHLEDANMERQPCFCKDDPERQGGVSELVIIKSEDEIISCTRSGITDMKSHRVRHCWE